MKKNSKDTLIYSFKIIFKNNETLIHKQFINFFANMIKLFTKGQINVRNCLKEVKEKHLVQLKRKRYSIQFPTIKR